MHQKQWEAITPDEFLKRWPYVTSLEKRNCMSVPYCKYKHRSTSKCCVHKMGKAAMDTGLVI